MAAKMSGLKGSLMRGLQRPQGDPKDVCGLLTLPAFDWTCEKKVHLLGAVTGHEAKARSLEWLAEIETWRSRREPETRQPSQSRDQRIDRCGLFGRGARGSLRANMFWQTTCSVNLGKFRMREPRLSSSPCMPRKLFVSLARTTMSELNCPGINCGVCSGRPPIQ
jgi:hypothetical protein